MHANSKIATILWPELLRGEPGSFNQGSEFGPGNTGCRAVRCGHPGKRTLKRQSAHVRDNKKASLLARGRFATQAGVLDLDHCLIHEGPEKDGLVRWLVLRFLHMLGTRKP